ncbi:hypothetical protein Cgig2_023160 [Carnegiea gigantea]|uniref:SWIM-type domain-containing protein n=1 Tax=Carnegiea gigantea TaxID=171969 RepID=A0A9Q1JY28_9CARY|nr:hypothetical protein Cgig2_023160 [Carnegiea gigantea]
MDNRKFGVEKWKNGVGERIEKKLKKTYENMGSVMEVQRFNRGIGEYSVRLSNDRCLVVRLSEGTCSCKWWQLRGLPCVHAMAVIEREKFNVYDYVSPCYKAPMQRTIYMNVIHPMETHDVGIVDGDTGHVGGGDELDEDFNRRILPPKNPRGAGRSRKRRIESQTQGVKARRCSKCGELGHYKNTCRNSRADVDADYVGDIVPIVCVVVAGSSMTYQCHCQLEAKIVEHHDNYRRRYACCPKQDEHACPYFEEVDPEYPNRAMEVIDELVAEMREAHDVLLEERNSQYWMEEEDRAVEGRMRAEVDEVKDVLSVALAAVMVLLAVVLVMWSF